MALAKAATLSDGRYFRSSLKHRLKNDSGNTPASELSVHVVKY